jgi:hypothetical protein
MKTITVEQLFNNYSSYVKKYIYVEGFYDDGYLHVNKNKDAGKRIYFPFGHTLDLDSYLVKMKKKDYRGHIRVLGMAGNKMYMKKNLDRIVKVELLDSDGNVTDRIVNEKIPLPKELRGKI